MSMRKSIVITALILLCSTIFMANASSLVRNALLTENNVLLTGFMVLPTTTEQCRPVKIAFNITNNTGMPILSQRPFSGMTYISQKTFSDFGYEAQPDRYMVGISLDGGKDGYPYRWGFRGSLAPGNSIAITGLLTIVEKGSHTLTPALLRGGKPIAKPQIAAITVKVVECRPKSESAVPKPGKPLQPIINGRQLPSPVTPYMLGDTVLLPARQVFDALGANIVWTARSVIFQQPGVVLEIFAGTQRALLNGIPIYLPVSAYVYGGVTYIPPRYVAPLFGAGVFWEPYPRTIRIFGPEYW
ncbi:MAG: copper amine oxidase N-terminal domain-containing protein [Armatimonadota bacterium]|nr:copper amine oxidase N-terminal domain-containing protein [Armatimonadota bacterium]